MSKVWQFSQEVHGALTQLGAWVDERVTQTDSAGEAPGQCTAPQEILTEVGRRDLFQLDTDLADRQGVIASSYLLRDLGGRCVTSAFSVWAHRMVIEYLSLAPAASPAVHELREKMIRGQAVGVTAFAAALQASAGLGELSVTAQKVNDQLVLNGRIPWASNLVDSAFLAIPVRFLSDDGQTETARGVVIAPSDAQGITIRFMPDLMALSNTASGMITLQNVTVDAGWTVTEDLATFLPRSRPVLLLLQASLGLGLAQRCIAEASDLLPQRGNVLADEVAGLQRDIADYATRLDLATLDPWAVESRELVELRLEIIRLALGAAQAEHVLRGGAGYVRASGTNRRLREALFLPVQSPSEVQLRQELLALG